MKLIIDINKEDYEYIRENKGMHYTMTTGICKAIFDDTPLEETLENQKEGRWKKISPAGIYECTCCGQDVMTSDIECYKFCHGCGARMEEIKQ